MASRKEYCERELAEESIKFLGKDGGALSVLREFRDRYVKSTIKGCVSVSKYYKIAPVLVDCIEQSGKKEIYFDYVYQVVETCAELIAIKEKERALREFKQMVWNLKKEFKLNTKTLDTSES